MKRFVTTALAVACLATPTLAQDAKVILEPSINPSLGQDTSLTEGADIYDYWCAACHNPGKPGSVAVMVIHEKPFPSDLVGQEGLDVDYVKYLVRNGQAAMPHFRKTQISDEQLQALAEHVAPKVE